jgi:phosphoglycolate phosphatase
MSAYDVILFDLDGTLIDSREGITKSLQYALFRFGIHENDTSRLLSFIGLLLLEIFQKYYLFDEPKAKRAIESYREYFSKLGIDQNAFYPGMHELLANLHRNKKKLAIATIKPAQFAKNILIHHGILDYFNHIAGGNLDETGPLKTEIIGRVLQKFPDTPKQDFIMIGDREHDIIGAHRNRIHSIAVTYGYGSMIELQRANPTYFASSIENLKLLLDD